MTLLVAVAGNLSSPAFGLTVPFTENFGSDAANWKDVNGATPTWLSRGGPDGSSYISTSASAYFLDDGDPVVLFRGQDGFDSSADSFVGNWLANGVNHFSVWVRHDAPVPLDFFVRFATAGNFPGVAADKTELIAPNAWTRLSYDIDSSFINSFLFPEGPNSFFFSTFGALGNIQVGYSVPHDFGLINSSFNFAIDEPSVSHETPEPAGWIIALCLGTAAAVWRRPGRPS
jgi:hypothetical protein